MTLRRRIVPRIEVRDEFAVKGIHLEGLRKVGDPAELARRYYEDGADELLFLDVRASLRGSNALKAVIERTADELCIPLCVGGGIRTLEDIRAALLAGADRVAVNTAAIRDADFLARASKAYGASTLAVNIEYDSLGECLTDNGREPTGRYVLEWAQEASRWAGEILLTSIDREGMCTGFDVSTLASVASSVDVPVMVAGGCGTSTDALQAFEAGADAVALSSVLHYGRTTVALMKSELSRAGVPVREEPAWMHPASVRDASCRTGDLAAVPSI